MSTDVWWGRPGVGSGLSSVTSGVASHRGPGGSRSSGGGTDEDSGGGHGSRRLRWGNSAKSEEELVETRGSLALRHILSRRASAADWDELAQLTSQRDDLDRAIQEARRRLGQEESAVMRTSKLDAALEGAWQMTSADERTFEAAVLPPNICFGAKALLILSLFALLYKIFGQQTEEVDDVYGFARLVWHVMQYVLLSLLCLLLVLCSRWQSSLLYFPVLIVYAFTMIAFFLPAEPFSDSGPCTTESCLGMKSVECAELQNFFMQVMMFCALFTPWVVPIHRFMRYCWGWIILVYLASHLWSVNMLASILFLSGAMVIAMHRKYYIERGQKNEFMLEVKQAEAGDLMFRVLEDMVPHFVVKRMLKDPLGRIADEVGCASILFITIVDFDRVARRHGPVELLELLNSVFTQFDAACEQCGVTKVETFCEEYVCAVGVNRGRREIETADDAGHEVLLKRLFEVAARILDLKVPEQPGVSFQMGAHTGPVVAGVIGQKLPRFRLFGDTMNTTARMMQKGLPGELQFGQETLSWLSRLPPEDAIPVRLRGPIEMKGKGQVTTYLLDHGSGRQGDSGTPSASQNPTVNLTPRSHHTGVATSDAPGSGVHQFNSSPCLVPRVTDSSAPSEGASPSGSPRRSPTGGSPSTFRRHTTWRSTFGSPRMGEQIGSMIRTVHDHVVGDASAVVDSQPRSARSAFRGSDLLREALSDVAPYLSVNNNRAQNWGHQLLDWTLPHRDAFYSESASNERHFLSWFHEELVCKKMPTRITNQMLCLILVTIVEIGMLFGSSDAHYHYAEDETVPVYYTVYIVSRALCVIVLLFWRSVVVLNKDWILRSARASQLCILASCWAVAILLFVSYDNTPLVSAADVVQDLDCNVGHEGSVVAGQNSYIPLACLPMYTLVTTTYRLRFHHSCSFIILAVLLMVYTIWIRPALHKSGLYTTESGSLVLPPAGMFVFVLTSALHAFESWEEEKSLRTRFKVRTTLETTRERIQNILNTLMPRMVFEELQVQQLQAGGAGQAATISHRYFRATIAQADLVGFTQLASTRRPGEVVALVSEVFGLFDRLTDDYEVYKIETVGDAYIAGQAEPPLTKVNSPRTVVIFGLAMVREVEKWSRERGEAVSCRVGVHTGACIGGIVGTKMQRYHLFGELMTCLDILESTAPQGCVQVSRACREAAEVDGSAAARHGDVAFELREEETLTTSKGEQHLAGKVGGPTSIALAR